MQKKKYRVGGMPANSIIIPFAVIIAILHIMISILIYEVNRSSNQLAGMLEQSSSLQENATNLQAGSSVLSETATTFAVVPTDGDGKVNAGPLMTSAQEMKRPRRGVNIVKTFLKEGASPSIQAYIDKAAQYTDEMRQTQIHAISLLKSVYPLPPTEELKTIAEIPLTAKEQAMPAEARVALARQLLMGKDYSQLKYKVNDTIEKCHIKLQKDFARHSKVIENHIIVLRRATWGVVITIIVMLLSAFALFYVWFVRPLRSAARKIEDDQSMGKSSAIREMHILVEAYNALLNRRQKLESILRSAAETDTLTGLPNRYCMERSMIDLDGRKESLAVLVFDVNYLKKTNDEKGHTAGDELLRKAAHCIRACFGVEDGDNCYRIGGDEFTAMICDCKEQEIVERIEKFKEMQKEKKISISVGYAYNDNTDERSLSAMMAEADRQMYTQKTQMHEQQEEGSDLNV